MKKGETKSIKFKWETEREYFYRSEIYKISARVSKILKTLADYKQQAKPNYLPCLFSIKSEIEKVNNLEVPDLYNMQHGLLLDGYDYYKKAFEILIEAFKTKLIATCSNDTKLAGRVANAAAFIETGNAYVKIVNTKNFESFQNRQEEYNKKGENKK